LNAKTIRGALYWGVPMLFCLILYWPGIFVWFHDDDFAFLGLLPGIHNWRDLADAIFRPTIHGTWRPLSERVYFIGVQWLFGTPHARPFRIIAFATQFANLALIGAITLRLTRSRVAGFLAPVLWIANAVLVHVMTWDATFIYALSGLALLGAFWLLLRYIETNHRRYYAGMWAVFLTGFLVMETNVVFPALAAAYTLLCARTYFRKTLPLFIPSILFVIADQLLITKQAAGPYAMHFNLGVLNSLREYWLMTLVPLNVATFTRFPESAAFVGMVLFTVGLLAFAIYQAIHRNLLPVFFLCWFGIVIGPVLPFQEHIVDYYPTLPSIGIAMLGAYAFAAAIHYRIWSGIAASGLVIFFLLESIPSARGGAKWFNDRSYEVKNLVLSAAQISRRNPDKVILLDGISDSLYWAAIADRPFRFLSIQNVYLAPDSEDCLPPTARTVNAATFIVPVETLRTASADHKLLVYIFAGNRLVNITDQYTLPPAETLNVGDPKKANQLDPTWQPAENGFRWTLKSALVRIDGPVSGCHKLYVSGYCPAPQLARGPLLMTVYVNGAALPAVRVDKADAEFNFEFPFKAAASGHYEIVVELDHTVTTPPDMRQLGLVFGTFEIR